MAKLIVLAILVNTFFIFCKAQTIYGPNSYSQAYAGSYARSSAYSDAYNGNIEMDIRYLPHLPWMPLYCRPDEELYGCINAGCGRWECSQPESGICIDVVPGGCIPGCRCREPLLRTDDGRCVPANHCPPPKCRGPNEFFMCGPACDNVCSELNIRNQTHCDILNIQCNPMCYCIEGHARDANGICVPIEHCPAQFCGENEEYTPSGICQARTCDDLGYSLPCYDPNSGITFNQGPGCVCKPGYVRDCNGKCIPNSQCPSCGGDPNATSGCSTFCTTCDNYGQEVFCIQSCMLNGCACRDGYIYDTVNKKCVLPQNCPAKICKKPNEILGCKNACPVRTCASTRFKQLYKCPPSPKNCEQACICAPGFFRNGNGDCVTRDQCFPNITCGPDEEYNSCANGGCGRWLCSQPGRICVNLLEGGCVPGCRCKAPLLRTSDGRCVPSNQCPLPQCGINEEYVQCKDSVCRPQACGDLGFPLGCQQAIANNNQSQTCQQGPGCVCKDGFVRDSNGNCISAAQCPSCGGDPNATTGCSTFCTTCDNYGQEAFCILSCLLNGCACKDGYIYDTVNKKCVLPQNCPPKQCTKPNEISGCNNTCPPRTCEAKDRIYECPLSPLTPQPCVQTCICAPGFYRNAAGDCVTKDQCLPLNCRPDEELYGCINAPCGRWECSQPESGICIDVVPGACIPGCKCKEPLLRTDDGRCVPASQCPPPQCGTNEEYVQCKDSVCRPQACGDLGFPLSCQQAIADNNQSQTCQQGPGCVCKDGFVRDSNGNNCISAEECPSCGGDPNATTGCSTFCTTCDNYGQEAFCILSCQLNGCACRNGYIYDTVNKKCVLPQNCPPKKCTKPNEISGCNNTCPPRTCEAKDRIYECPLSPLTPQPCVQTCICAPGFYRNAAGDCVTKDQCLPLNCRPDEELYGCINAPCGRWECSQPESGICIDVVPGACIPGCKCKEPLLRTDDGRCVPASQCPPPQCGLNEEYVQCTDSVCRPQTCGDLGFPLPCQQAIADSNQACYQGPGCVCKEGFVRDSNGNCISAKECPSCGGDPNATTGCSTFCTTCDNYGQEAFCILSCQVNGCACKDGYIYDTVNKKCVLPKNCPKKCNKPNEVTGCKNACPPRTCEAKDREYKCRPRPQLCEPECVCAPGFYRNAGGNCVTKAQCDQCSGPNEFFSCGGACDNVCSELSIRNQTKCDIINIKCNDKCYCLEGFARDAKGICIPINQCPNPVQCGDNAEFVTEPVCRPETCSDLGFPLPCLDPESGITASHGPGCVCKVGFVRDNNGKCVSEKHCPSCGGDPNATTGCSTFCTTCDNYGQEAFCILSCQLNGCACRNGYIYDTVNKKCVLPQNCPPKKCTKPNEISGCNNTCPPRTCEAKDRIYECPLSPLTPQPCVQTCICAPGFYRNAAGDCVTKDQCLSNITCGPDEEYNGCSNGGCGRWLCSQPAPLCIDLIEGGCIPGCRCKAPLLKTSDGRCVPSDQCPQPQCGLNEEYVQCTDSVCRPQTCGDLGFPLPCQQAIADSNQACYQGPGCVCKEGFVRDSNGNCISAKECPSCGGDPNATTGCSTFCTTCDNYGQEAFCILSCQVNGCACKDGYIYDTVNKKCVLPKNCPKKCNKPNEVTGCKNACPPRTCEAKDREYKCRPRPQLCEPECVCAPGFYRNAGGNCVTKAQCDQCSGPNEFFSCGGACDNVCSELSIRNQTKCDIINIKCNDKCYCLEGFARDAKGICIPINQCPNPVQCGDNAEFVTEPVCRPETCSDLGFPLPCLGPESGITASHGPGCVCKVGFVRDNNGKCVSEKHCPKKCNKPNEITGCKNACPPRTCEAKDREYKCPPRPQLCEPECVCAPGFYRNAGGNCVTKKQCDKCSGPNEFFSCGGACDNVCSELSIRNQTICDIINIKCNDKCYCLEGFARDAKGICIPIKQCPNPVQCGDNAEFVTEPVCRPETCSDLGFPLPCLDPQSGITASHGPGCVCKIGFVRDNYGKCVSEKQCPSCGGDANASIGCGTFCETCDNYGQNAPCILICKPNSCACKNGYIYDKLNKKCVLPQNCPAKCNKPNEELGCQNNCPPRVCESIGKDIKCPIVAQVCIPACNCKKGFFRNKAGDCVSKQQCLEPPKCGKNEVYAKAVSCPPQTCLSRLALINCPPQNATNIAKYECRCKPGFLRNEIDECIPADKCSSCNGKNEIYARSVSCPPQTCTSITARYICSEFKPPTTEFECRCRPGFFRNKINKCISTEECGKCTGPNEYYFCGPACDNVCSELSIRNQTNCDIINVKCNDKCYCIKGHARDANGICVPIKDCPPQCGPNQEYVECPDAVCRPKTCDQVGFPVACPDLSTGLSCQSKPGCICSEGYVQHQNGTCIPYSACPSCGGDTNAVSGCGVYCNTKCTGNTKICPRICKYNSCDCKPGFLLDTVLNACVLPDKCTCGPNEVFSKCTNRACHRSNCAQLSIPWVCRALATSSSPDNSCVPGCECVPGYLKNSNGVCVPQNQCPEAQNLTGSNTNTGGVNAAAQLENGNGVFTSRFLYEAAKNNPGQSVVASPLSVLFLLAQLALFATGAALEQLNALLNLNSPQQIRGTIPPYLISFNSEKNIVLRLAERVYGSEKYPFSESFKDVTRNVFLAEAQNLDFSNPKDAAKAINDWIASQTNNLIQNLVPENSLNADTRLVLTNAIYMRANFSKPFNKENTQPKDFHVSDTKTVTVQMMNQVSRFRYGVMPKSQAQVVELPYQNENATLLILLPPKTADGMDNLLEEQLGFSSITDVLSNLSYKKVNLSIPSFGTETRTDLKDILEKAGVKQIFQTDSGLSGIFAKPENVSVSYASQLAKITVDEFGAEAAAGNAIVVGVTSVGVIEDPIDFYADRNFLYFLLLRGNPLFCGRYAGPQ